MIGKTEGAQVFVCVFACIRMLLTGVGDARAAVFMSVCACACEYVRVCVCSVWTAVVRK